MARHTNNNSFNIQLRELEEEDELQGYDVKNARRSKKKIVSDIVERVGEPIRPKVEPMRMPKYDLSKYGITDQDT